MKPSKPSEQILRILSFFLMVLLVAAAPGGAQENERKLPVAPPPRQAPPKKPQPAPARPMLQPALKPAQPRVRRPVPPSPRPAQPEGNPAAGRPAGGQGNQPATQINQRRVGDSRASGRPGGAHPPAAAGGVPSPPGLRLPPNARSVAMPGGGTAVVHPDGRRWEVDNTSHVRAFSRPGLQAKFDDHGRVSAVHVVRPNSNMLILRSQHGAREAVDFRPGGVFVVTFGKGRGYVQRPLAGRPGCFQRTSLVNGRTYASVYRGYRYHGIIYFRYQPAHYYQRRFYQWVSNPWPRSAAYNWGSGPAPWASFYSGYFAPAQTYPTAALWLTDFVLVQNLKIAYQDHQEYELSSTGPSTSNESSLEAAALTPEVKEAISQEVQGEVTEEDADASQAGGVAAPVNGQEAPPVLDPNQRTIVMSQTWDVPQAGGSCTLTAGDVVSRKEDNLLPGGKVEVSVLSAKAGDCPAGTSTQIDLATLQEMHNQFHEQIDAGLSTLAESGGQSGLPAGPPAGTRPVPEGTAQPDRDVVATLAQQQNDATAAEATATDGAKAVGFM